jgi:hypothetical protein
VGKAHGIAEEEKVRSTVVKPSNGQANKNKPKGQAKSKSPGLGLRRLTKRQRIKIARIAMIVFLIIFTFSIVGGLVAVSVRVPGH